MQKNTLGKFGPEITTIGLGTWALGGGDWQFAWGDQDDKDSLSVIEKSLEHGVNWIDTAAVYGLGHAEKLLGQALKGKRQKVFIATKGGLPWNEKGNTYRDSSPANLRKECEDSLQRLKTDYIDLYQIHWADAKIPFETSWAEMMKLKQEGKIRFAGVSNYNVKMLEACQQVGHVDSLQPPYNLVNRYVEKDILPWAKSNGTGVIAYSPAASGMLSGKYNMQTIAALPENDWRKRNHHFDDEQLEKVFSFVLELKKFSKEKNIQVFDLAIAWVLHHPAVTAAIVGARNAKQAEQNTLASKVVLTAEDLKQMDEIWQRTIRV